MQAFCTADKSCDPHQYFALVESSAETPVELARQQYVKCSSSEEQI